MSILHPRFAALRAFAAEELPERRRARVAAHLARCPRCRATISSIRELKAAVRESTELPLPAGAWKGVLARRAAGETIILPKAAGTAHVRARSGPRRRGPSPLLRRAAAVMLVAGTAGTAFALVPGSPVRGWWERAWGDASGAAASTTQPAPAPAEEESRSVPVAGMSVLPVDGEVRVAIDAPDSLLRIRVRLTDAAEAQVSARGDAAAAVFRTAPGRIGVEKAGPGEVVVSLPRDARHATLLVDGTTYLRKDGPRIYVLAPSADTVGADLVLRIHP